MKEEDYKYRDRIYDVVYLFDDYTIITVSFFYVLTPNKEQIEKVKNVAAHEGHRNRCKLDLFTFKNGDVSQFLGHDLLLFLQVVKKRYI